MANRKHETTWSKWDLFTLVALEHATGCNLHNRKNRAGDYIVTIATDNQLKKIKDYAVRTCQERGPDGSVTIGECASWFLQNRLLSCCKTTLEWVERADLD